VRKGVKDLIIMSLSRVIDHRQSNNCSFKTVVLTIYTARTMSSILEKKQSEDRRRFRWNLLGSAERVKGSKKERLYSNKIEEKGAE